MIYYFDNVATTPVKGDVFNAMVPWLTCHYGNPSSHYSLGRTALEALEESRKIVANTIGADPDEIFFTSCGSEANSWALKYCPKGMHVFVSPIEHHSVLNAAKQHHVEYMKVDKYGCVDIDNFEDRISRTTYITSVMMVNNEVGTIQSIKEFADICHKNGTLLHVDAVQALGHIRINVKDSDLKYVQMLSLSGHKIGAPKGIGALYIRKNFQQFMKPLIFGGQQEQGLRGGTENISYIVGFAKACELIQYNSLATRKKAQYVWDFLKDNIPNVHMNGLPIIDTRHISNILNVSIDGVRGEELVTLLDMQGICISTGSACNSNSDEPSHVLKAMGISDERANSSIRISFGEDTSLADVNYLCQKIVEDVEILRGQV